MNDLKVEENGENLDQPVQAPVGDIQGAPVISSEPLPKKHIPTTYIVIGGALLLAIIMTALLYLKSLQQAPVTQVPVPTPIQIVTPTPMRILSRIASTSAFANFHSAVASLSGTLNSFNFHDATLAPPILDTDLGLSSP